MLAPCLAAATAATIPDGVEPYTRTSYSAVAVAVRLNAPMHAPMTTSSARITMQSVKAALVDLEKKKKVELPFFLKITEIKRDQKTS